jgi:hypothetical protein
MSNIFTDPIFPAIKNSKARWATYKSTCDRQLDGPCWGTPEYHKWHNEESRVGREWEIAFQDMLVTQPTTREGALGPVRGLVARNRHGFSRLCRPSRN